MKEEDTEDVEAEDSEADHKGRGYDDPRHNG